jgi:ComF family protein
VRPITPPVCSGCGEPLASWRTISRGLARCGRCRRLPPVIDRMRSAAYYEGPLREIVHALKYGGRPSLARPLAALMGAGGAGILEGADAVVPVPLDPARLRRRGFNQARLLAEGLGPPVLDALARTRPTPPQTGLPAARRHANVRDAFAVCRPVAGLTLVLIDDVATTGATLHACARALRAAGAREIRALTAARAAAPPAPPPPRR